MLQCDGVIELNLTKGSHEHLRETFDIFCDQRCSFSQNSFDVYDVLRVFNLLGEEPTLDEIEDIFDEIDVHNHGFISFFTFCLFMMDSGNVNVTSPRSTKNRLALDDTFTFLQPDLDEDSKKEEVDKKLKKFQLDMRELETAFELFDAAGKGFITGADIRKVFCCVGETLSEAEVNTIIHEGDLEGKGYIDFRDFQRLINTHDFICTYDEKEPQEEAISIYDPRTPVSHPKIVEIFDPFTIVNLRNHVILPTLDSIDRSWENSKEHTRSASCKDATEHQLSELDMKFADAQSQGEDSGSDVSTSISCSVSLFKAGKRHSSMFERESIDDLLAETTYYNPSS